MATATIAAIAALVSAGAGVAGVATANRGSAQQAFGLQQGALQDSRNNEAITRALQTLAIQQSRSGFTDSLGNSVTYDPATNTWNTTTTPQTAENQRAELAATLARNTTDQTQARQINTDAERRSLDADLARGPALSEIQNYNPVRGSELASTLAARAGMANESAYRPIRQDLIRTSIRGSSNAGQPLADLASRQSEDLRKGILDAQVAGQTGAADINKSNLASMLAKYTTLNTNAQPQLQTPGIQGDNTNQTLATVAADRARTAASAPFSAGYIGNQATGLGNQASSSAAGAVAPSSQDILGKQLFGLGDIFSNPKTISGAGTIYDKFFGSSGTGQIPAPAGFPTNDPTVNPGGKKQVFLDNG